MVSTELPSHSGAYDGFPFLWEVFHNCSVATHGPTTQDNRFYHAPSSSASRGRGLELKMLDGSLVIVAGDSIGSGSMA